MKISRIETLITSSVVNMNYYNITLSTEARNKWLKNETKGLEHNQTYEWGTKEKKYFKCLQSTRFF